MYTLLCSWSLDGGAQTGCLRTTRRTGGCGQDYFTLGYTLWIHTLFIDKVTAKQYSDNQSDIRRIQTDFEKDVLHHIASKIGRPDY